MSTLSESKFSFISVIWLTCLSYFRLVLDCCIAFNALTLLVVRQEEHPACKILVMRCWTVGVVIYLE